jgi:D-alanine-D-alanine ligase
MDQEANKKNIGVFFGSQSPEHDVSIITGQLIIAGLKGLGYPVVPVYITKQGKWMIGEHLGEMKIFTNPSLTLPLKGEGKWWLDMEESVGKMVFKKKGLVGKTIIIDLAFPALHGSFGEDGTIQGLFEMLGVPYVGCDVTSSALAMDKALTKQMYTQHQIPTTKFVYFFKEDWEKNRELVKQKIRELEKYPLFVKPVHLGSSIGIGKVKDEKELEHRVEVALYYDHKVLVEEGVENLMDVTCCVIGNETPQASLLQESVFAAELFDFEEKYLKQGGAQTGKATDNVIIPARLDEATTKAIQDMAKQVYKILGCSGIARVDFLYDKQIKKFFANEVNPLPGTLYHHLWKASGLELPELLEKLIKFAQEKYEQNRQINLTFQSSILQHLNSKKLKSAKLF